MRLVIKRSCYGFNKLTLCDVSSIGFLMPLPPFPYLWIQIQYYHSKFRHVMCNVMEGEIMFHLDHPTCWVRSIKLVHFNFWEASLHSIIHERWFIGTNKGWWLMGFNIFGGFYPWYVFLVLIPMEMWWYDPNKHSLDLLGHVLVFLFNIDA